MCVVFFCICFSFCSFPFSHLYRLTVEWQVFWISKLATRTHKFTHQIYLAQKRKYLPPQKKKKRSKTKTAMHSKIHEENETTRTYNVSILPRGVAFPVKKCSIIHNTFAGCFVASKCVCFKIIMKIRRIKKGNLLFVQMNVFILACM